MNFGLIKFFLKVLILFYIKVKEAIKMKKDIKFLFNILKSLGDLSQNDIIIGGYTINVLVIYPKDLAP